VGNLAILAWTLVATVAVWLTYATATWIFPLLTLFMIYVLLRRLGCSTCAYCKTCTSGFGRLAGWFFGNDTTKDRSNKTALAFVLIIYCLLAVIPIYLIANSMIQGITEIKAIVLISILVLSIYSVATWLKPSRKVVSLRL
jgi:hypothetical protein